MNSLPVHHRSATGWSVAKAIFLMLERMSERRVKMSRSSSGR